ncbi:MAG: exodeoxyribonuclease VII small subunit [Puniceicoccales bacterium]|jgi:exodeoxyribonuclease VII small subunit|nr:exodeoxyribonuclease VII small subunit [Puniceicoccales bacterium]
MKKGSRRQLSFEQKLQQLEHVVAEMETEGVTLEALLEKYREGHALLAACQEELDRAEMIIRTFEGTSLSDGSEESTGDEEGTSEVSECS